MNSGPVMPCTAALSGFWNQYFSEAQDLLDSNDCARCVVTKTTTIVFGDGSSITVQTPLESGCRPELLQPANPPLPDGCTLTPAGPMGFCQVICDSNSIMVFHHMCKCNAHDQSTVVFADPLVPPK